MPRAPLYYTFANHMHWSDMQWLWGHHVLPGSIRDMLRLIEETGARGNVNFDAIGYEKLAAEAPEALAELRAAVADGRVEPVGCSYGQPYGLFQGGESNVRQITFGVRSTRRLLGVRPCAFWEEEFYFFPQLPQILASCGYTGACLFFQWTWHTPEVPREACPLIAWEGLDGTRLPAVPRGELNVHQWPEEFDGLLDKVADGSWRAGSVEGPGAPPAIAQWLELMPSRDWMCRSEVLMPRLKELFADRRFEVRPRTLSALIAELARAGEPPVRRYTMDDVWHGMTLGKNADRHPRASRDCERALVAAESLSALAGLFGRPYASWDVYPMWELDEAWRNTLAGQHHDNHECEGLCGFVGHQQFDAARAAASEVLGRAHWLLRHRAGVEDPWWAFRANSLGWARTVNPGGEGDEARRLLLPPFGYADPVRSKPAAALAVHTRRARGTITLFRAAFRCTIDAKSGAMTCLAGLAFRSPTPSFCMRLGGGPIRFKPPKVTLEEGFDGPIVVIIHPFTSGLGRGTRAARGKSGRGEGAFTTTIAIAPDLDAIDLSCTVSGGEDGFETIRPDPGLVAAAMIAFNPDLAGATLRADTPYAIAEVVGSGEVRRKYPTADWMTSPQWFEGVRGAFTSLSLVDLFDPASSRGVLIAHNGSQQWFRDSAGVRAILTAYDPWDEGRFGSPDHCFNFRLFPHAGITNADRIRIASEFAIAEGEPVPDEDARPVGGGTAFGVRKDIPRSFGALEVCDAPGVLAHAFCRESMKAGEHLPQWAGHRMFAESEGACDLPFVIRLVEWNGEPAEVVLKLPGPVAMAAKTNPLGEVAGPDAAWLSPGPTSPPVWARAAKLRGKAIPWSEVRFRMRPREIATIYADLVMGRKEWRNLDAKREVWAKVHKTALTRRVRE